MLLGVSDYSALGEVSRLLRERLRTAFLAEPQLNPLFGGGGFLVSLETPKEMASGSPPQVGLSVWLYQIERNEFLNNRKAERIDATHLAATPIPINLHYLLTPISDDPHTEQLIMGKVLEVLHEDPVVPPSPAHPELDDKVRISLENPNLDVLARVWTALLEPYRLCTSYLVEVVDIASRLPIQSAPVLDKVTSFDKVLAVT